MALALLSGKQFQLERWKNRRHFVMYVPMYNQIFIAYKSRLTKNLRLWSEYYHWNYYLWIGCQWKMADIASNLFVLKPWTFFKSPNRSQTHFRRIRSIEKKKKTLAFCFILILLWEEMNKNSYQRYRKKKSNRWFIAWKCLFAQRLQNEHDWKLKNVIPRKIS